jgi:hypothetical protein
MGRWGESRAAWIGRLLARVLGFLMLAAATGAHAETQVDLALVLAVDASGSVDMHRFELQKQGYAAAFRNPRVLNAFAAAIAAAPRQLFGGGTSISGAIDYGRLLLLQSGVAPTRRVIDVSGDGSNNSGRPVTFARDEAARDGIGVNGLPILSIEPGLDHYYRDYVIGGPGAFMVPADSYDTFADAILKKLITEIAERESKRSGG